MYIVEGTIGVGKSTFLKLVSKKMPQLEVAFEPLHKWQNKGFGQSLLSHFYASPQRWAYSMETFAMACRVIDHIHQQQNNGVPLLMERSIYSGHYVFAHNGYTHGFMTDLEWQMYSECFQLLTQRCKPPRGFIYLRTSPEVAYERIKKRQRADEALLPFEYLQQLDHCYENFLVRKEKCADDIAQVPVLVLDCNQEFEANAAKQEEFFAALAEFIE